MRSMVEGQARLIRFVPLPLAGGARGGHERSAPSLTPTTTAAARKSAAHWRAPPRGPRPT
jgi:hypothetical protein